MHRTFCPNPPLKEPATHSGRRANLTACLLAALLVTGCRPTADTPSHPVAPPAAAGVTPQVPADFTYDPATMQPLEEPPAHLTKAQRAQWWVAHNHEQRRLTAEAEAARQAELQRQRTQLELLDAQRRQAAQAASQPSPLAPTRPAAPPAHALVPGAVSPSPSSTRITKPVESAPADSRLPPAKISFYPGATSGLVRISKPRSLYGPVKVRGYYRKDGVYVSAHSRQRPH